MLIFLDRTYRGRPHKWWLQSSIMLILAIFLCSLTYYFAHLYAEYQLLKVENERLQPYVLGYRQALVLNRVNYAYDYLQYLNQFERFEKNARLAKWMRLYHSKQALYSQKNDLERVLTSDMVVPIMMTLGKELSAWSQQWENASLKEKNQMQLQFKQTISAYEMVAKRHGYKILSSDWTRQKIIQSWYDFMLNQLDESVNKKVITLPSYQALYSKLDSLVEFYFQLPNLENTWIKPDRALLEKTKMQLNLNKDADIILSQH